MLDRKNPYSAIPQLEKKIDNISTEQTDIGLDYSAFKEQTKHDLIVIDGEIVDANALIVAETNRATGVENELRAIVDNTIETWFYSGVPTLSNPPAYNWTTDVLKDRHVGDLYYDNATGYAYRFVKVGSVYSWNRLSDSAVVEALAVARTKRKIWVGSGTPEWTPDEGDLWCNPSGDTKVWNGTLWIKSSKYTDDTLAQSALDYAGVVDGKVDDVATDLSDEVTRATGVEIGLATDISNETSARQTADSNLSTRITTAQATADGKNTVYYSNVQPSGSSYKIGDTWFDTGNGNRINQWNGSSWVSRTIGTNAINDSAITGAKIVDDAITNSKLANNSVDTEQIVNNAIESAKLNDGSVTTSKIDALAVTTAKIGNGAITNAKIGNLAVSNAQIQDGAITSAKIGSAEIKTANIEDGAITNAKVGNLDAGKITTGTLNANRIAANSLTIGKIATADQKQILNSNVQVGARNYALGTGEPISAVGRNVDNQCIVLYPLSLTVEELNAIPTGCLIISFDMTLSSNITGTSGTPYIAVGQYNRPWNRTIVTETVAGTYHKEIVISNRAWTDNLLGARINWVDTNCEITFSNFKMEIGNKYTSWTPAPEDIDSDISSKANVTDLEEVQTSADQKVAIGDSNIEDITDVMQFADGTITVGNDTNATEITRAGIIIRNETYEVFVSADELKSANSRLSTIKLRNAQNDAGNLAWVAESDGSVSLKVVSD